MNCQNRLIIPARSELMYEPGRMGRVMNPIDYFMAIFAGICIGLVGVAYILG